MSQIPKALFKASEKRFSFILEKADIDGGACIVSQILKVLMRGLRNVAEGMDTSSTPAYAHECDVRAA